MTISEITPLLLIPFAGTVVGAASVLLVGERFAERIQRILLGFASGVMIAASVWSLLIPAMNESAEMGRLAWVPATVGLLLGVLFMLLLDTFTPHLHPDSNVPEGPKSKLGRSSMLVLAVTLHNIPEGMAVGVVAAGLLTGEVGMTFAGALALQILRSKGITLAAHINQIGSVFDTSPNFAAVDEETLSQLEGKPFPVFSDSAGFAMRQTIEEARMIRDSIIPEMENARRFADNLEILVARSYWPFPTYGDLLFGV